MSDPRLSMGLKNVSQYQIICPIYDPAISETVPVRDVVSVLPLVATDRQGLG